MYPAPGSEFDDATLRGGCALGCVAATMAGALGALALAALLALALGVGESLSAVRSPTEVTHTTVDGTADAAMEQDTAEQQAPTDDKGS